MIYWLAVFAAIYVLLLGFNTFNAYKKNKSSQTEFLVARGGVHSVLIFLSFSATLFSTFTILGIPDFFRVHGVATWFYIGVTDVAMGFVVLWFGILFRRHVESHGFYSVSSALRTATGGHLFPVIYVVAIFIFLVPYVSIQIRGVAIFLEATIPLSLSSTGWSLIILAMMFMYSAVGGLRAIIYSDVVQGLVLVAVIWIAGFTALRLSGGVEQLFADAASQSQSLMSAPGPRGLLSQQFLIGSFIAILLMPITQPQLTTRIALVKNTKELKIISIAISVFALVILLPTIPLGLYGAVYVPEVSAGEFLRTVLVEIQHPIVGALAVVGLVAAAMSTADSQLFALGSEARSFVEKDLNDNGNRRSALISRGFVLAFAIAAFILSLSSDTQLALLARVSFAGTGLVAPLVLWPLLRPQRNNVVIAASTIISLALYLGSQFGLVSTSLAGLRLDLGLLLAQAGVLLVCLIVSRPRRSDGQLD